MAIKLEGMKRVGFVASIEVIRYAFKFLSEN
jgi:hypothetical protein